MAVIQSDGISQRKALVGADGFWQAQSAPALGGHGSASEGLRLVTLCCEVSDEVKIKFYVSGKRCKENHA